MNADVLTILVVASLGAIIGTGVGLSAGYLLKKQKTNWNDMSRNEKLTNIALVLAGSAICIAGLAWYAFR